MLAGEPEISHVSSGIGGIVHHGTRRTFFLFQHCTPKFTLSPKSKTGLFTEEGKLVRVGEGCRGLSCGEAVAGRGALWSDDGRLQSNNSPPQRPSTLPNSAQGSVTLSSLDKPTANLDNPRHPSPKLSIVSPESPASTLWGQGHGYLDPKTVPQTLTTMRVAWHPMRGGEKKMSGQSTMRCIPP